MSKVSSLESHIPPTLMASVQKSNDMVQSRATALITATGGESYSAGSTAEFKVQSGAPLLIKSVGLTGNIKAVGAYNTTGLRLQDGVRSCVSSINVMVANKQLVNLNADAQLVPLVFQNSEYSYEDYYEANQLCLGTNGAVVPLAGGTAKQFYLPLREYGLDINKLLQTGNGRALTVKVQFENDMKKVFWGAADGTNLAKGFTITNLKLSVEYYTLYPAAQKALMDGLLHQSVDYYTYAYNVQNVTLPATTSVDVHFNTAYRDIAAVYFIPKLAVTTNDSGIPTLNPLDANLKWNGAVATATAGSIPDRLLCNFPGLNPANINGTDGQSGVIDRNRSLQAVSKHSPSDRQSGYGWGQYVAANTQTGVLAVNFLKTDTKSPEIMGGGANGYAASSQLNLKLNLDAATVAGMQLFAVSQFVRRLRVSANSVDAEE